MNHDPPNNNELDKQMIRLEERMKTVNAENASAQERLKATLERFRTDAERRETEAAKRETRFVFYMIAIMSISLTIFGFVTS